MIRAFLKPVVALAGAILLGGCVGKFEIAELSPKPPELSGQKIPDRYVVALVGRFADPVIMQEKRGGRTVLEITVPVGPSLRKTVIAALTETLADPLIVPDEDAARGIGKNEKLPTIIVAYERANVSGTSRQAGLAMNSHVQMTLGGSLTVIDRNGAEVSRSITAVANSSHTSYSPFVVDVSLPAPRAAAEEASTYFARRVAAELRFLITGTVASLEQ